MNPHIILRSIKAFIRSYEASLVADLESNGLPKRIGQLTTSRSTPSEAAQRIFIGIIFPGAEETYDARKLGTAVAYAYVVNQQADNRYRIEIHVGDYAVPQDGEEIGGTYEPYEKDTETFWTFVSRLVKLFRKYTAIPASSGNFTIEVYGDGSSADRRIGVTDFSQTITDEQGGVYTALYAILDFQIQTCGEPDPLA